SRPQALLARALYDNHPDCSYELAFCRGDILTILEQNVPESEGWWKCLLHGRQGLAPANRLQLLPEAPADRPCAPFLKGLEEALTTSEGTDQVPTLLKPQAPGPVYEHMKSWVVGPLPTTAQVYEFPDLPSRARIVCEKTLSLPKQVSTLPNKTGGAPLTSAITLRHGGYNTLPSPQKSEWIYDTPVSPEKANTRNASLSSFVGRSAPHTPPTYTYGIHCPPDSRARSLDPHLHKNVPMQKKLSLPEIPTYKCLAPRDTFPLDEGVGYKVPSSFLIPQGEQQNTKPNIYDIPKATPSGPRAQNELGRADGASENGTDRGSSWLSRQPPSLSPEPDSLSVSSSDSRASIVSSCSSTSTDSSSSACSEESGRELCLDLDLARETVAALQHKVASSVASLMLFVSRKWRFRDYLEANISGIRRAADHVEESLRAFLDFARAVRGTACNLSDTNLQARIRDQLQTISNCYQVLLGTKESLDGCNWSLEVLVMDKIQNSPDDLERFVMAARMVPEDVKRFASIVIANGKLLFR
ncbi:CASS4 protein, partial [Crocuta crocuta]